MKNKLSKTKIKIIERLINSASECSDRLVSIVDQGDNEEDVLYARSQAKVEKAVRAARKVFAKELESMKSA